MHTHTYICVKRAMHESVCLYLHTHISHTYVYMCACICTYLTYAYTHILHIHMDVCMYTYVGMYACTHVHIMMLPLRQHSNLTVNNATYILNEKP